ncbi:hypothetical protein Mterra_02874 [Calidithermus terrae]|uniref:N-carbamoyl-L-amino acid amidohydrolase n=1 Tax=Calidithermus terrae TaxID=1408545 RepID=A0A399EFW9_9DEIN|nr:N-carbamoyl-L-amino acid amidohydrolase [Calidithermus terrae]RIH81970.1 hypothetical protein Mterra_02874 [Calidithermus terrae]
MARNSPYLRDWRLADLIAAITLMGRYPYASLKWQEWEYRLGSPRSAGDWRTVFYEHPEFFRLSDEEEEWASLRLRHGLDRTYSVPLRRELSAEELRAAESSDAAYKDVTRRPLNPDEIDALVRTAIDLHARTIAHEQERRWLTPLLWSLLGTIVGIVLQSALR